MHYNDKTNIRRLINMISVPIGLLAGAAVYSTVAALSPQVGMAINVATVAASLMLYGMD
jgi:hypothetical protein